MVVVVVVVGVVGGERGRQINKITAELRTQNPDGLGMV